MSKQKALLKEESKMILCIRCVAANLLYMLCEAEEMSKIVKIQEEPQCSIKFK